MNVYLLNSYPDEQIAYQAAAICVDKYDTASYYNMKSAVESNHLSILEHLPMTFLIEDISRSCSHQLVRHRIGFSYSQQSQRYAEFDSKASFVLPHTKVSKIGFEALESILEQISNTYELLIDEGMYPEEARCILPNATPTSLILTTNGRALITACNERLCGKAQLEIRELFQLMREKIKLVYPTIYKLCVPKCITYGTCKEKHPCKERLKYESND